MILRQWIFIYKFRKFFDFRANAFASWQNLVYVCNRATMNTTNAPFPHVLQAIELHERRLEWADKLRI